MRVIRSKRRVVCLTPLLISFTPELNELFSRGGGMAFYSSLCALMVVAGLGLGSCQNYVHITQFLVTTALVGCSWCPHWVPPEADAETMTQCKSFISELKKLQEEGK